MADIILVAVTVAFIAMCVGYVNWCDRIIGPDDISETVAEPAETAADHSPITDRAAEPAEVTA